MRKDVFVDGHEQPDVVEDRNRFLTKIEELKSYVVEVNEDGAIKAKDYPVDCAVGFSFYLTMPPVIQFM